MTYSEALEQQLMLLRRVSGRSTADLFKGLTPDVGLFRDVGEADWRELLVGNLAHGDPVYWAADLCDVLERTAPSLPDWSVDVHTLISESAFVWFAKPLALPRWSFEGSPMGGLMAIGWQRVRQRYEPAATQGRVFYSGTEEVPAYEWLIITFFVQGMADGRPHPIGAVPLMQGEQLVNLKIDAELPPAAAAAVVASGPLMGLMARYVGTALTFMHQKIVVAPHEQIDRATRKRLERQGLTRQPLVRVVRLRRTAHRTALTDHGAPAEWSCRWIVRGHWRQHWFPRLEQRRWLWILPYVKGPEDKPLKPPRATVFAVVR